jgi:hypothetical protein
MAVKDIQGGAMQRYVLLALIVFACLSPNVVFAAEIEIVSNKDAYVDEMFEDWNCGVEPIIYIHTDWTDEEHWFANGLVEFDLSDLIDHGYVVDEASLILYVTYLPLDVSPIDFCRIAEPWAEGDGSSGVTWLTRPDTNRQIFARSTPPMGTELDPAVWVIDVTEIVQSWLDGFPNYGFYIDVPNIGAPWIEVDLVSSDNTNPDLYPRLYVNYHYEDACEETPTDRALLEVNSLSANQVSISFSLPAAVRASLAIYDASGSLVETLMDGTPGPGDHTLTWDGAPGIYFVRLETPGRVLTEKLIILK